MVWSRWQGNRQGSRRLRQGSGQRIDCRNHRPRTRVACERAAGNAELRGQVFGFDHLRWCHDGEPVTNVFELTHIARKGEILERHHSAVGDALGLHTQLLGTVLQEMPRQHGNVLTTLAQRRQAQANDVEPMVQIFAKHALFNALLQVLVGRCYHAHIGLHRTVPADAVKVTVAQHPQEAGLQLKRHVTNFIQEERALISLLKATPALGLSTGKGSALMPE